MPARVNVSLFHSINNFISFALAFLRMHLAHKIQPIEFISSLSLLFYNRRKSICPRDVLHTFASTLKCTDMTVVFRKHEN